MFMAYTIEVAGFQWPSNRRIEQMLSKVGWRLDEEVEVIMEYKG